jgi:chaperonin GroES
MSVRPLHDRVLVKPIVEEQTKSGIVLPDTADKKSQEGEVVAVGPGRWNEDNTKRVSLDVKVGDRVMFAKYAGSEFKLDDIEHLILSEKDILAIVNKN